MDLPESARWHPLRAARRYERLAEEAAGLHQTAFTEYARLRDEYRQRHGGASSAVDFKFKGMAEAGNCASDVGTYATRAQVFAAMAAMKYQRYLADQEMARANITVHLS